jgi:hypothetical protein
MMKMQPRRYGTGAALALALAAGACGPKPAPEATPSPTPTPVACAASASWVTSPSQPNFEVDPTDHCGFYQYAWQSFLYLTSTSGGAAVFESWPTVDEVFASTGAKLGAPKGAKLFSFLDPRTKKKRFLRQRVNKATPKLAADGTPIGDEDQQAGSGGILVDQTGNITYYEQFLDPSEAVPFIDACTLTISACQSQPGAASLRFPAGSLELKVSWRPLWKATPNVDSFYLIAGSPVQNAAGETVTPDYFGLVGFHLVYSLPGHPEMVWATFEHVANAPDAPCVSGESTCGQLPSGFTSWSYNNCQTTSCTGVNEWTSPPPSPIPSAQAFLNYPLGTIGSITDAAGVSGSDNIAILNALNQSVLGVLSSDSVWRNYTLSGAVWTLNGALPAVPYYASSGQANSGFNEAGSPFLANATMETFTQFPNPVPSPFPSPAPVQNCMTCHNEFDSSQGSFQVSHAFFNGTSGSCSWSTTPPAACTATQPTSTAAAKPAKPGS